MNLYEMLQNYMKLLAMGIKTRLTSLAAHATTRRKGGGNESLVTHGTMAEVQTINSPSPEWCHISKA